MSEIKLLPCPFCGGEAYTYTATSVTNGEKTKVWQVHCKDCRLNYPLNIKCLTEEEAIEKWNARKPMERILKILEMRLNPKAMLYEADYFTGLYEAIEIVKEVGGIE